MPHISQNVKLRAEQKDFFTYSKKKLTNGAILIISTVLKHVMSSAAEAKM
jgi:hypothetical protein